MEIRPAKFPSEEIEMILTRMDTHPEEFISEDWHFYGDSIWNSEPWKDTRWGNLIGCLFRSGANILLSKTDYKALRKKYKNLVREKVRNDTVANLLVEAKSQPEQLDLPYMPAIPPRRMSLSKSEELKKVFEEYKAYKLKPQADNP